MVLDIILIILFVLMMLYGYKKGCIGIVAKLVSLILAFVLSYFLASVVGSYIADTSWGVNVTTSIEDKILGELSSSEQNTVIVMVQDKLGLVDENEIINKIIDYVFTGIGFVVVFVIARIILWIVQKILESIFELPILNAFNKVGGVITATVLFLIEISIILAVIKSVSTISFMNTVVNNIQSSVITRSLYDHNIFTNIILNKII